MRHWVLIAAVLFAMPAQACLWAGGERQVFFKQLPAGAEKLAVVAEVDLTSTSMDSSAHGRDNIVTVTKPIKGVHYGETFHILTDTSDCSRDFDLKAGEKYFIAGVRDAKGNFRGEWDGSGKFLFSESNH